MISRYMITIVLTLCFAGVLSLSAAAQDARMIALGVSSSIDGYTVQLRVEPEMSFLTFARVSPEVNRIRIRDAVTGLDIYFGRPEAGTRVYLPKGDYYITGWCAYPNDSDNAAIAALTPDAETSVNVIVEPGGYYKSFEYHYNDHREIYRTYRYSRGGNLIINNDY